MDADLQRALYEFADFARRRFRLSRHRVSCLDMLWVLCGVLASVIALLNLCRKLVHIVIFRLMFFFVGGISPKVVVEATRRLCPNCNDNLVQKRVDHVLTLFFMPIWTVSRGNPVTECERCGWVAYSRGSFGQPSPPLPSTHSQLPSNASRPTYQSPPSYQPRPPPPAPSGPFVNEQPSAPLLPPSCPACGNGVKHDFLFCPYCGQYLKNE